jgi:hypothetical protein
LDWWRTKRLKLAGMHGRIMGVISATLIEERFVIFAK